MSFKTVETTLSADVASGGTFIIGYPEDTNSGTFQNAVGHYIMAVGAQFDDPADISIAFGASSITVTYNGAATLPAGASVHVQLAELGADDGEVDPLTGVKRTVFASMLAVNLGAPDVLDADGVSATQLLGVAGNFTIGGALASGGVATFDVPRNVTLTGATTDHSGVTFTVTGTDEYGATVVETMSGPNNSTVAGKKAFKTVTQVAADGAIATNTVSVGTGDVLGLPIAVPDTGFVLGELEDGAAATAGTVVAAVASAATATTGDVRGTYDANSACDGAKAFTLLIAATDPSYLGAAQYAG